MLFKMLHSFIIFFEVLVFHKDVEGCIKFHLVLREKIKCKGICFCKCIAFFFFFRVTPVRISFSSFNFCILRINNVHRQSLKG